MLLESCCCGCSLRSGSLGIASFALIGNLAVAGVCLFAGIEVPEVRIAAWVVAALSFIVAIFAVILICGILKEVRGMVMAWVYVMAVIVGLNLLLSAIGAAMSSNFGSIVGALLGAMLWTYFILVVRSYGIKMKDNQAGASKDAEMPPSAPLPTTNGNYHIGFKYDPNIPNKTIPN